MRSPRPAWSGMMQMVHTGDHPGQSSVLFLPMIDLDHGNMACVHSTFKCLCEHAARYNVIPIITFESQENHNNYNEPSASNTTVVMFETARA